MPKHSRETALLRLDDRSTGLRPHNSYGGRRILDQLRGRPNRTTDQLSTAIGANESELLLGAIATVSALKSTDVSLAGIRR